MQNSWFGQRLIKWYKQHKRALPWRETRNPYTIWLSEIILQQTRVAQGTPYYHRFVAAYPTVKHLAEAPQDEVLKLWEGLGYYSRARNMHAAAKHIVKEHDGKFPATHKEILALKGVGHYTAAAISSFAYDLPHAVLDGNVYRVLARVFGIDIPINTSPAQRAFGDLAQTLLDKKQPAEYNQAVMEFGALLCLPKNPDCKNCIFNDKCLALANGTVQELPKKNKASKKRERYFYYFHLINEHGQTAVNQRRGKGIWENLFEFPLVEFDEPQEQNKVLKAASENNWIRSTQGKHVVLKSLKPHLLSHQKIFSTILTLPAKEVNPKNQLTWVDEDRLNELAFPVLLRKYLDENQLTLPF